MLEFDESFFEGEEREGFFVEGEMKHAWAAQLEVLVEIDRICQKYGIQWYAEYGTLLGAVRHEGFVPWDDDMDISMKREDYMRFMEVAAGELPKGWYLLSPQKMGNWKQPFMRIVNGYKFNISPEFLQQFHGCPYVVGIDIFPLDSLPENDAELEVLKILYQDTLYVKELIRNREKGVDEEKMDALNQEIEKGIVQLEDYLRFKVDREGNIVNQLLRRVEELSALYAGEGDKLGVICFMKINKKERIREKSWYDECVLLPFENIMIPAPKGYDAVLRTDYGDYMTPVRGKGSHDYPFYKEHKKEVQEMIEKVNQLKERLTDLEEAIEE